MTWTATLLQAEDRDSFWKIVVEFANGEQAVERAYQFTGGTATELKQFVRAQALKLERTDPVDLTPLVGKSIDVTPPVVIPADPPTQSETDKATWFAEWRQLNQLLKVIAILPALENAQATTLITSLKASLELGWDNSYLGDM